ncbi:HNH endonuclease [Burkholderia cenocepacia]
MDLATFVAKSEKEKRCTSCKQWKDRALFNRDRTRHDGLSAKCLGCTHCGDDKGGNLEAHHRKEWAEYPELRFDVSNGITLCRACHWLAHAYHGCVPGLN